MSGCLLDTNAWIALLKNDPQVVDGVRRAGIAALHLCAPVWSELWFGACNTQRVAENVIGDFAPSRISSPVLDGVKACHTPPSPAIGFTATTAAPWGRSHAYRPLADFPAATRHLCRRVPTSGGKTWLTLRSV